MPVHALTPYAHVRDIHRSIDFYGQLGLEVRNSHHEDGRLVWAFLTSPAADPNAAGARLMLAVADGPVDAPAQGILFYCWTRDVRRLRLALGAAGVDVGEIEQPFYMRSGELRIVDPDGYVVLVGQLDDAPG